MEICHTDRYCIPIGIILGSDRAAGDHQAPTEDRHGSARRRPRPLRRAGLRRDLHPRDLFPGRTHEGRVYSNFANKDALFLALLDRTWARRAARVRNLLPAMPPRPPTASEAPPAIVSGPVDRQWTLVSTEFSLHAIRHPEVAVLLADHERRVRAELAALIAEALEEMGRRPTIPVDELARMTVAVTEGSDIQALTDAAAGAPVRGGQGPRTVAALVDHYSVPVDGGSR